MSRSRTPHHLTFIVCRLKYTYIINVQICGEIITHSCGNSTSTFLFATIETITCTTVGTRLRKAPCGGGYGRVEKDEDVYEDSSKGVLRYRVCQGVG